MVKINIIKLPIALTTRLWARYIFPCTSYHW